ncbi:MOSC domain protein [Halalkalicoccus paucihalophilus]|uniref:MOSC domain protein n=1 Tax=Halalkalicoccus paucihalophilus TaxID=1008153 RepID=A0A151AEH8_9EURY|nr:MOSC N-terminal beta barrel domain-containing protein [Halalkalicoccus paucihalophilus]KYH26015.1 MOSC domain protein [Halalkalicoccus paucihalophilus]
MDPRLARISLFPIKSLDAFEPERAEVTSEGPIAGDRRYAMVDNEGEYVNGKRTPAVHRLRASYHDPDRADLSMLESDADEFDLRADREELAARLSEHFEYPIELIRDETGLPDDTEIPGPTVISTATIETVASWFDLAPENVRRRFRANLEIGGVPAFWEDRLFSDHGRVVDFSVGGVRLSGVNPCQRCVVPSRDPDTGEELDGFRERFVAKRRETLPEWTDSDRFDHPFRLMVNTRVQDDGEVEVGDPVEIRGERDELE